MAINLNISTPNTLPSGLTPLPKVPAPATSMLNAPMNQAPQLNTLRPIVTSPREQRIQFLQQQIQKEQQPGPPKPGFWHRLGRIAAGIGNVAGDVFDPAAMELIPGTQLHNQLQLSQNTRELAGLQAQDLAEQNDAAKRNLEGFEATPTLKLTPTSEGYGAFNDKTGTITPTGAQEPQKWTPATAPTGQVISSPSGQILEKDQYGNTRLANLPAGASLGEKTSPEPHDAFHEWLSDPSKYGEFMKAMQAGKGEKGAYGGFGPAFLAYHLLNSAYSENPALLPVIAPLISKMFQSAGNTQEAGAVEQAISQLPAGQPKDAQGQAIGLRMPEAPTGATRSRAQFAQAVMPTIDRGIQGLKSLEGTQEDLVGPLKGRWLEFYQGKVGANDPKYAALRTNLDNIGTAWMRLHANSEKAREQFAHLLRTSQTLPDLVASLNAIRDQANDYVKEGNGRPDELNAQEPSTQSEKFTKYSSDGKWGWNGEKWVSLGGSK